MNNQTPMEIQKATPDDLAEIETLQERIYKEEGYLSCNHSHALAHEFPFNDSSHTETFIATRTHSDGAKEIVGSLSITEGDKEGFPIFLRDFPDATERLSSDQSKICVLWRFIVTPRCRSSFRTAMLLIMEALICGRRRNISRAICAVNPKKHGLFYRHQLGFTEIDQCENVSGLQNAPAVLLFAFVEDLQERYHPLVRKLSSLHQAHETV